MILLNCHFQHIVMQALLDVQRIIRRKLLLLLLQLLLLTIIYNTLSHLITIHSLYTGGALYSEVNVAVDVTECSCESNTAVRFAGALFHSAGGSITASTFTKCTATSGGAIYSQVRLARNLHSTAQHELVGTNTGWQCLL